MGYSVTVYMASTGDNVDPYVETIDIYMGAAGKVDSVNYGEESHTTSGLTDEITLKPTLADGYVIKRWAYHVGSESAITLYSYTTNFTYTPADPDNPANLYIRAESEPDETSGGGGDDPEDYIADETVTIDTSEWGSIARARALDGIITRVAVTFTKSGYVKFYSYSQIYTDYYFDMDAWISLSPTIQSNLTPKQYVKKDSTSQTRKDFNIEYYVEKDTTYYFIYRLYEYQESYNNTWISVTISPPEEAPTTGLSEVYIYNNGWVAATPYIYNGSQWVQASPYILNG